MDGAKLDYFPASDGGDSKRIAKFEGTAVNWWLRSPSVNTSYAVAAVSTTGRDRRYNVTVSRGIRPAIILPSDMLVTDDMLAV